MRISINSAVKLDYTEVGFGNAISNVYKSLKTLGHTVSVNDRTAPVQLNWMQPDLYQGNRFQHQILYTPWESTELRTGWQGIINADNVQEFWTTSPWCKKVFEEAGVKKDKPITVFQHGISSEWRPVHRKRKGPLRFLIVDAEANRKGWQEAFNAFRAVFKDNPKLATLTIKTRQRSMIRWFDENNMVRDPAELPNVTINVSRLSNDEMVQLYHNHDVFLGPSYGEGFGFLPFQMLATGGIAITTKEWAPYSEFLGDMALKSSYGPTKWQGEHPGLVCYPDQEHLEELIKLSYEDFENQAHQFFSRSLDLHAKYDWVRLTEKAFSDLNEIF
jgi:glycosyltransferase involved in cell wall biosynthesis